MGKIKKNNKPEPVRQIIENVITEICDHYCKYPYEWDEDKEGMELCESEICQNCPLMKL